jgi:hypothetical protein
MLSLTHVVGIDPGIVHTGAVRLVVVPRHRMLYVTHGVISGLNPQKVKAFTDYEPAEALGHRPTIFIEGYRARSHFQQDADMLKGVRDIKAATRGKVLHNTGIKKVVKRSLLEVLGLWSFSTPTNHDDLRSAARILVLGMLKDEEMNQLLTYILIDHLEGNLWAITA